jgi:hypothetical protein
MRVLKYLEFSVRAFKLSESKEKQEMFYYIPLYINSDETLDT